MKNRSVAVGFGVKTVIVGWAAMTNLKLLLTIFKAAHLLHNYGGQL